MKASGGWENLKTQAVRRGTLGHNAAARRGKTLKGKKPYGRSHYVGLIGPGERDLSRKLGWVGSVKWRLGVWVSSVKESKPRRGSSYLRK